MQGHPAHALRVSLGYVRSAKAGGDGPGAKLAAWLSLHGQRRPPTNTSTVFVFQDEAAADATQVAENEEEEVLTNFNLTVPKGIKLGIVGESGSGKSTLTAGVLAAYQRFLELKINTADFDASILSPPLLVDEQLDL